MRHLPGIFVIMILLLPACKKQPLAQAYISPNQAYVDELITYTNLSENAERVEWDMGDGNTYEYINYQDSICHSFSQWGEYNVLLVVTMRVSVSPPFLQGRAMRTCSGSRNG